MCALKACKSCPDKLKGLYKGVGWLVGWLETITQTVFWPLSRKLTLKMAVELLCCPKESCGPLLSVPQRRITVELYSRVWIHVKPVSSALDKPVWQLKCSSSTLPCWLICPITQHKEVGSLGWLLESCDIAVYLCVCCNRFSHHVGAISVLFTIVSHRQTSSHKPS